MNTHINTRRLVYNALLCGITILLGFTPLGMLPLPAPLLSVTTVHIPVLVACLYLGYKSGTIVASCFGLISFIRAIQAPIGLSIVFINPLTAILPRLMIPVIACSAYYLLKKIIKSDIICLIISAMIGTMTNTIFVLSTIYFFHGATLTSIVEKIIQNGGNAKNAIDFLVYGIGIPNGLSESILSAILVPAIVKALRKTIK